jgi:hypothetical protein
VTENRRATADDLGQVLGALTRPGTPEAGAFRRLAEAIQAFTDSLQTDATPVQVRVHVFCDPRPRTGRAALDVTCQALTEDQLERASASGAWEDRERMHNWSPGQEPWDLQNRTPGRYRSRHMRMTLDGLSAILRLDADAAFHARPSRPASQGAPATRSEDAP